MTTIAIVPSSPPATQGSAPFLSPTKASRLAKTARALPARLRPKPARLFPMIAVDRSHSAIVFAILFAAAAIVLFLTARALLDFARPVSPAMPALEQRLEQGALPGAKNSPARMIRFVREIRL